MTEALGTVARTLSVLRVVAEAKGTVGVKDVADALGLPMSTSHRLLDLLLEAGFVQKEQIKRRYAIGSEFFRLANLIAHKTSYASLVQPILDELARETGETAMFASYVPARHCISYAAKSDSPNSLRFRIELFQETPARMGLDRPRGASRSCPRRSGCVLVRARGRRPSADAVSTRAAFAERLAAVRATIRLRRGEKLPTPSHCRAARGDARRDHRLPRAHASPSALHESRTRGYIQ